MADDMQNELVNDLMTRIQILETEKESTAQADSSKDERINQLSSQCAKAEDNVQKLQREVEELKS